MSVEWKDVKGWEEYYRVSSDGQIYSKHSNKILKQFTRGSRKDNKYLVVNLYTRSNDKYVSVHRIVAEAFLENPKNLPCVNHKDGNKFNNNVSNLEWISYKDNNIHAIKTGLKRYKKGSANKNSKLSYQEVFDIKQQLILHDSVYGARPLALKYGVDHNVILDIFHNKKYQDVQVPPVYFVSSDIHGAYDIWMDALNKAGFNKNKYTHKLIVCGDLFDRFPGAVQVYEFVKSLGDRFIYIRGNHEDLLFDCVQELRENGGCASSHHYSNGTVNTVVQLMEKNIVDEVLDFINNKSIDYYETKNYIFVHGWIPNDNDKAAPYYSRDSKHSYNPNWREASKEQWESARWDNGMRCWEQGVREPNKVIVCGHWNCSYGNYNIHHLGSGEYCEDAHFEPFVDEGIIALDGCTKYSKRSNVIVLEDESESN